MRILLFECEKCKNNDIRVLQIDHKNGGGTSEIKKFGNTRSMWRFYLKHPEIAKKNLQTLCANCHVIKHKQNQVLQEFIYSGKSKQELLVG